MVYASIDNPALVIGTNYGRIFMIPMFQETDVKVFPVVLIDQHHLSPITQLFIAYDSSRRVKSGHRSGGGSMLSSQNMRDHLQEQGGHLISVSEDGTVAITNLNSGEIQRALVTFNLPDRSKGRADLFMKEVSENRKLKRRHSFASGFTMNQFYHLVKVKSQQVYDYCSFGKIEKIIEVKNLVKLQERVITAKQTQAGSTFEKKQDEEQSFQGMNHQAELNTHQESIYACLSSDGMVLILQLSPMSASLTKLHGLDSLAIGVYLSQELSHYYVLTDSLQLFVYSKKSLVLERKADFKYAMSVLLIREAVDFLLIKNESVRLACACTSTSDSSVFEYETFEKVFRRKSLQIMGQGSHKILDFLSISLNLPLLYHPHSLTQGNSSSATKYTKSMLDLLNRQRQLGEFSKKEDAQKIILRVINDTFFMNNALYKSDFNEEYYHRQSGVTVLQTRDTVLGSRQQIIIANTKQMINVMKNKLLKIKNQIVAKN